MQEELQAHILQISALKQTLADTQQALSQMNKQLFDSESHVSVLLADNNLLKQECANKNIELENLTVAFDHLNKETKTSVQKNNVAWEKKFREKEHLVEQLIVANDQQWEAT
jgi:dynactin complex subunit